MRRARATLKSLGWSRDGTSGAHAVLIVTKPHPFDCLACNVWLWYVQNTCNMCACRTLKVCVHVCRIFVWDVQSSSAYHWRKLTGDGGPFLHQLHHLSTVSRHAGIVFLEGSFVQLQFLLQPCPLPLSSGGILQGTLLPGYLLHTNNTPGMDCGSCSTLTIQLSHSSLTVWHDRMFLCAHTLSCEE